MPSKAPELTIAPSVLGVVRLRQRARGAVRTGDDAPDLQAVLAGEGEVALVVRRHGHDGAGAVAHQHVVGDPDGDALAVDRVDGIGAGEDAGLLLVGGRALDLALAGGLGRVRLHRGALLGVVIGVHQRMLRRQHHEGRAPQRVGPRGEDLQRVAGLRVEDDLGALAAADPVGLHGLDALGPVDGLQQQSSSSSA